MKLRDTDVDNVNPYHLFDWVVDRNPNFDFNQYIALEDYDASSVVPSSWQPSVFLYCCLLNCLLSVNVGSSSHKRLPIALSAK